MTSIIAIASILIASPFTMQSAQAGGDICEAQNACFQTFSEAEQSCIEQSTVDWMNELFPDAIAELVFVNDPFCIDEDWDFLCEADYIVICVGIADNELQTCINENPCEECSDTDWNDAGICVPLTECTDEQYETVPPTETSDRECTGLTVCVEGEFEAEPPTETSDRVCLPIPMVDIDIKPASDPNSINTKSMGVVPVAILGSADFDVTEIDVTTLTFGPDGASPVHDLSDPDTYDLHLQDVNEDGFLDLVSHYKQKEVGLCVDDTEATISGTLLDGTPFEGTDSVRPLHAPDC